jgi:hypothetical protein
MGWFQDVIWNNVFKYAYPISFMGAMAYGILSIAQVQASQIIANPNVLIIINSFIGICGVLSFAAWYNTDISVFNSVTTYLDLDANKTRNIVAKTN